MARTTPTPPVAPPPRPRGPEPSPDPARWRELSEDFARLVAERRDAQSRTAATAPDERVPPDDPELGAVDLRGDAPAVPSTDRPPDAGGRERDVVTSAQERERRASGERVSAHGASDARAADVAVSEALAERERRAEEAPDDADVSKGPEGAAADDVWMPAFDAFGQPVAASAGEREPASRTPARADEESGTDGEPGAVTAEIERLLGARVAGDGRLGDPNEPGSWRFSIVGDDDGRSADAFVVTRLESGTMTVTIEAERAHADAALDELTRRLAAVDERIVVEVHGRLDPPA